MTATATAAATMKPDAAYAVLLIGERTHPAVWERFKRPAAEIPAGIWQSARKVLEAIKDVAASADLPPYRIEEMFDEGEAHPEEGAADTNWTMSGAPYTTTLAVISEKINGQRAMNIWYLRLVIGANSYNVHESKNIY